MKCEICKTGMLAVEIYAHKSGLRVKSGANKCVYPTSTPKPLLRNSALFTEFKKD
jgi:hypothetical protein